MKTTTKTKTEVKVNLGGLDGDAIYTATGKLARAQHNADRHATRTKDNEPNIFYPPTPLNTITNSIRLKGKFLTDIGITFYFFPPLNYTI